MAKEGERRRQGQRRGPGMGLNGEDLDGYIKSATKKGRNGGYYNGGHPQNRNTPALTSHEYGDGKAVFLAFDWLAEMTALDLAGEEGQGPMDGLMERALEHTAPASLSAVAGEPVPLRLMVENTGPALTVTVGLNWNNGGELLDVVPGMDGGHQWRFALEAGEARTLQAWIGSDPDDDSVLIEAVFEGEGPSGNQVTTSKPVSYTNLTLPTNREEEDSVVGV